MSIVEQYHARRAVSPSPEENVTTTTARRAMREGRGRAYAAGLLPWLVVGLGVALGVHGTTMAMWASNTQLTTLAAQTSITGFSVQRDGSDAPDVATGPGQTVGFELTSDDAKAIATAEGQSLAIGFTIKWMTSGTDGLDYKISLGNVPVDSFLDDADIQFFPKGSDGCVVGATSGRVLTDSATGATIAVAPSEDPRPAGTGGSQAWCLVATFNGVTDQYNTTASAAGTDANGGSVNSNQAPWSVTVGPDPAAQQPVAINVTHVTTKLVGVG